MENTTPALARGLALLEHVARLQPVGFNRLQAETGLNTSSLNRLLRTLADRDYIRKNCDGKYNLGLKLLALSYGGTAVQAAVQSVHGILENIRDEFGVTVLFVLFLASGNYILDKVICPDNVAMRDIGDLRTDYAANPWGHLRLLRMPEPERQAFLDGAPPEHRALFSACGDGALHSGFADDRGLFFSYMRRIAVPVMDSAGTPVGALAAGSFRNLMDDAKALSLAQQLRRCAAHLIL